MSGGGAVRGIGLGLGLLGLVAALGLGGAVIGPRPVTWPTLVAALTAFDPGNFDHQVIWRMRLPRLAAGLLAGAALGVAGTLLQSLLRNPLGDPHILGLNAGAGLAVVAATALPGGLADWPAARPLVAAAGGGALFVLVLALASAGRAGMTMAKLTFCGIALSALAATLTTAILLLDEETLNSVRLWMVGDLAGASLQACRAALAPLALAFVLAWGLAGRMNLMGLGDAMAASLGVAVTRTRLLGLTAAALLCGGAVSLAGTVGFVGLIVPVLARRLCRHDHRAMLPCAAALGAGLLLAADLAARTLLAPRDLATGLVTAFVGAPVFVALVSRRPR